MESVDGGAIFHLESIVIVPRLHPGVPPELVVHDEEAHCPYLPGRVSRLPLRLPARALDRGELDQRLALGDRRQGVVLYRTACPECQACVPLRVPVTSFKPDRAQRRALSRGDAELRVEVGDPKVDPRRVELYNLHREGRGLADEQPLIDEEGYHDFLVDTCCDCFEIRYYRGKELVGVAVTDRGERSLSAVYCYYDPKFRGVGIGTYSILKQIQLSASWKLDHLYLGLFIAESSKMAYKARFLPHERLQHGRWVCFDRPGN